MQTASSVACSAPTRIDLAGGTIDIWPLYLFHDGASTLNAAISLRARAEVSPRADGEIEVRSIDTGRQCRAAHWSEIPSGDGLSLLALLARHYRLENATLTTRGESPAGAGIAGSTALAIAACGALARWTGGSFEADDLLRVAMNVECQAIRVPTGVQDYRPALYGGIAAIELGVDGIRRVGLDVEPGELERRIVLAYTGAPRNSGTNNWEITKRHLDGDRQLFDCFERIRDIAVAMRGAAGRRLERGGPPIAKEWENRNACGRRHDANDEELIARVTAAGAEAAKVCGPEAVGASPATARRRAGSIAARSPQAARGCSITVSRWKACGLDNVAIARILKEIADLLEIRNDNPFKIRAYRNGADIVGNHPHSLVTLDVAALREIPGIGKDLASRIREIAETGGSDYHRELVAEFPPSVLDLLHLQGVGPKTVATLFRELGVRTLEDLERAAAEGRIRALRGMGAKKEALILKALEERKRHAGRHLLPAAHEAAAVLVAYLRERAPSADIMPVGSLRRGCDTCGDLDILASGADQDLMDAFVGHPLVERVLARGETKSSVLLRGGFRPIAAGHAESRGAAMHFTGSKTHNIASRSAIDRGQVERMLPVHARGDARGRADEEGIYAALGLA